MKRLSAACLAVLAAALVTRLPAAAAEIPPALAQRLASVESEEDAEHYVSAYLHLMEIKKAATAANEAGALERIDDLEGYLATMAKQDTQKQLEVYLHQQAAENADVRSVLERSKPGEPLFRFECGYEEAEGYACATTIEDKLYRCVAGTAGVRCRSGSDN